MPRPPDPGARARLLGAARAVFSERGLDRAKVVDIASQAQLSKGAFYLHFESKEAAFRELLAGLISELERMVDESSEQQLATGPGSVTFEEYLEAIHAKNVAIYEFVWENRTFMAMVLEGGGSASYHYLIEDFALRAQRKTAALLLHGADIGLYRDDLDLEAAATFIAGGYDRIARQLVREKRKPDIDGRLREVQWLFLSGIARPQALRMIDREVQKLPGSGRIASRPRHVSRSEGTG